MFPEWRVSMRGEACVRVAESEARECPERCGVCGEPCSTNGSGETWRVVTGRWTGEARCDWCSSEEASK